MAADPPLNNEPVLVFRRSPVAMAAAEVVRTLCGWRKELIDAEPAVNPQVPGIGLLILVHLAGRSDVAHLVGLRKRGFAGPVLVVSNDSFERLLRDYRILRSGQGSHAVLPWPFLVRDLLSQAVSLYTLEPENLQDLQYELNTDGPAVGEKIMVLLRHLEDPAADRDAALSALADKLERLRTLTPVACHSKVEVRGEVLQIQEHFWRLLEELAMSPEKQGEVMDALCQVVDEWRLLVSFGTNTETFADN